MGDKQSSSKHEPEQSKESRPARRPEPPRTTTGPITAPKFGSAGSGGAELDPGPENSSEP